MDGYNYIFNEAINNYKNHGSRLENFRDIKNNPMLYNFMINGGEIDEDSLSRANQINEELYNKFLKQKKKGLTGYKGVVTNNIKNNKRGFCTHIGKNYHVKNDNNIKIISRKDFPDKITMRLKDI